MINPDHLLDQAHNLIVSGSTGRPRQVDYRRALSAIYYALFHASLTKAVDSIIPLNRRQSLNYELAYRSIQHKKLREIANAITQPRPPNNLARYFPANGFSTDIVTFASACVEMYEKRHLADYDPFYRVTRSDALVAVSTARAALGHLSRMTPDELFAFSTLLFFANQKGR